MTNPVPLWQRHVTCTFNIYCLYATYVWNTLNEAINADSLVRFLALYILLGSVKGAFIGFCLLPGVSNADVYIPTFHQIPSALPFIYKWTFCSAQIAEEETKLKVGKIESSGALPD